MQSFHDESTLDEDDPNLIEAAQLAIETGVRLTRFVRRTIRSSPSSDLSLARLRALAFLLDNPAVCLSDLADHLIVGVPTASKLVDDLVERGLLSRSSDESDRRRLALSLTNEGERVLKRAARPAQEGVAGLLERLSPEDRARVIQGLSLLRPLLDTPGPEDPDD